MTIFYVLSLLLGFAGSSLLIAACFSGQRSNVLRLNLASGILFLLSYLSKGDFIATFMVITATVRTLLFILESRKRFNWLTRSRVIFFMIPLIIAAWTAGSLLTPWSWLRLLILAAPIALLIGLSFEDIRWLKLFTIITSTLWLNYEFFTGAYTIMIGEVGGLLMASLAFRRAVLLHRGSATQESNSTR